MQAFAVGQHCAGLHALRARDLDPGDRQIDRMGGEGETRVPPEVEIELQIAGRAINGLGVDLHLEVTRVGVSGVRLRVLRAQGKPPKAQCRQLLADATLGQHDAAFRLDAVLPVTATPAHHAVANRVGTGLDPGRKRAELFRRQPPGALRHPSGSSAR